MKNINVCITYLTNFKPSKNIQANFSFSYKNKQNTILCKNFIVFFYLVKFVLAKKSSIKIFLKPKKNKIETLLRPPYRHKISRHQITLSRYYFLIKFSLPLVSQLELSNPDQVTFLISELKKYFSFFESNICYTHNIKLQFSIKLKNFFFLMNYKI